MIRIGAVNIDTSHPLGFAEAMKKSDRAGYVGVYSAPVRPDAGDDVVGGAANPIDIIIYGHICLLRDIAQAVQEERMPMLPPEEAALAVKAICSIYESTKTGLPVHF